MYIVNREVVEEEMRAKGYPSIRALAKGLDLHRNTVSGYLSGQPVLPDALDRILDALALSPGDALKKVEKIPSSIEIIAPVVDELGREFPQLTMILFGSRAKGSHKKYSDFDLGVFSLEGIDPAKYRRLLRKKEELEENLPYFLDLVNLCEAREDFFRAIGNDWIFLRGNAQDWLELKRKVAERASS